MYVNFCLRPLFALFLFEASSAWHNNPGPKQPSVAEVFFSHNEGLRVNTDALIYAALTEKHAGSHITVVPAYSADLFSFAAAGQATSTELTDSADLNFFAWRMYQPPSRRLDGGNGSLNDSVKFGVYQYTWQDEDFLIYLVDGRDGSDPYGITENQYIISSSKSTVDALIMSAGQYSSMLHDEIWVFDMGYWQKDSELWKAVEHASWANVILAESMKTSIQNDVLSFFSSRETYADLNVPWKRGVIFHGPPGNGKTISIKAIMHDLYNATPVVPALYVKTLASWGGPEYALREIFRQARAEAPCLLVFEDLDSLVTPEVRSYFLNQVDGLQVNDGILMVGSTNHLELLDPGISHRPSRFDRKYLFPDPGIEQRAAYAAFWRAKIEKQRGKSGLEFPEILIQPIAGITEGFSFAYMQEAFIGSLLEIARGNDADPEDEAQRLPDDKELQKYRLWRVIKKQVISLRKELEQQTAADEEVDVAEPEGRCMHCASKSAALVEQQIL